MAALALDRKKARANSRPTAIRLVEMTLRSMETWRQRVGDYDGAMILLAVVAISAGRLLRADLPLELRDMTKQVSPEALGKCNIASIAAAIGLNRETTRRRVAELVERGFLEKADDGSIRFPPGYLQTGGTAAIISSQVELFVRTANELLRSGVLIVDPAP